MEGAIKTHLRAGNQASPVLFPNSPVPFCLSLPQRQHHHAYRQVHYAYTSYNAQFKLIQIN